MCSIVVVATVCALVMVVVLVMMTARVTLTSPRRAMETEMGVNRGRRIPSDILRGDSGLGKGADRERIVCACVCV